MGTRPIKEIRICLMNFSKRLQYYLVV